LLGGVNVEAVDLPDLFGVLIVVLGGAVLAEPSDLPFAPRD
jgi:hypothetical protein